MAAYLELFALIDDPDMQKRVKYALFISARSLRQSPNATIQEKTWADKVFKGGLETPFQYIMTLVVSSGPVNASGALVTDAQLQGVINALVPILVSGEVT